MNFGLMILLIENSKNLLKWHVIAVKNLSVLSIFYCVVTLTNLSNRLGN